jgi:hypothetical protein
MVRSQNGWTANDRSLIATRTPPGTRLRLPVRIGPAGDLLLEVVALFDLMVQDVDQGADDWGYAERPIRGATALSNHASGTAVDVNATRWSLGSAASVNLTPRQIQTVREIVAATGGVVRWGGDYTGRKDPMHFEINNGQTDATCARALARLRATYGHPATTGPVVVVHPEEDDLTPDQIRMLSEIHRETTSKLPNRRGPNGEALGQPPFADTLFGFAMNADGSSYRTAWDVDAVHRRLDELTATIQGLAEAREGAPAPGLDYDQLAAALLRRMAG